MKKGFRLFAVVVLLFGILFLASSQSAWAGNLIHPSSGTVQGQDQAALQGHDRGHDRDREPGSVKPPPVVVPPIKKPGTYSVGGVCVLKVERLSDKVSLHALLQSFNVLDRHPKDIGRYLAGVCTITYVKEGRGTTNLLPADGSVKICFAPVPKKDSKIYVYAGRNWTALDTKLENGLLCADASKAGKYILASKP
jgi:hypothetical protein